MLRGILNSRISYSTGDDEFVTGSQSSIPKYRTLKALRWFNACSSRRPITFCRDGFLANGSPSRICPDLIRSRSLRSQMSFGNVLALLPSTQFVLGQTAWVIEIEDTTTLFAPFPRIDGKRLYPRLLGLDGIYDSGFLPSRQSLTGK